MTVATGLVEILEDASTFYWRVRAQDSGGNVGPYSGDLKLVTGNAFPKPSLGPPADGAHPASLAPLLDWSDVAGAAYTLYVSSYPDFSQIKITSAGISLSNYQVTPADGLSDLTSYYWRVKAFSVNDVSLSSANLFYLENAYPKASLGPPGDGKRVMSATPLLDWSNVAGAAYTLHVSSYPDFSQIKITSAGISLSNYQVTPADGLSNLTTFYWKVTAIAATDVSYSTANRFYVDAVSTATLAFPDDLDITSDKTPTFSWSLPASLRDLTFALEWADNQDMTGALTQTGLTTGTYTLSPGQALARGTTYYWRAKTLGDEGATALTASTRSFTVTSNRIAYTLETSTFSALTPIYSSVTIMSGDLVTPTTNEYTLSGAEALNFGARYHWRVKAEDSGGNAVYASSASFSTLSPPVISTPAFTAISTDSLTVNWTSGTAVIGYNPPGTGYSVDLSTAADFTGIVLSSETANLSAAFFGLLSNTTYFARGAAFVGATTTTYRALGAVAALAQPISGAQVYAVFSGSITLNWAALPESPPAASSATGRGYRVEASTAADFTGTISFASNTVVTASTLTITGLTGSTTYYLRAGALNWSSLPNYAVIGSTLTGIGFIDCGMRLYDGTATTVIACEPEGSLTSELRARKGGITYGLVAVPTSDPNASRIRVKTASGIKSLRKHP